MWIAASCHIADYKFLNVHESIGIGQISQKTSSNPPNDLTHESELDITKLSVEKNSIFLMICGALVINCIFLAVSDEYVFFNEVILHCSQLL